jgi:hypothetical protein
MKYRIDGRSFIIGAFLGAVIMVSVAAATSFGRPTVWEYQTIAGKVFGDESGLDEAINSNTAQGWEFDSASPSFEQCGVAVVRRAKK